MPTDAAVAARDAGLRRVKWLTRGTVAAAVALTGAFSAVAAHAFPGRSGQRATAVPLPADTVAPPVAETTVPPTTSPPTTVAPSASVAHRPLQPPVTAPRAVVPVRPAVTPAPAPVVRRVRPHAVSGAS
ncbi:MAG: hypothetical protein JO155_01415 [Acidimicrobiia bacterium]|nr:hypothetical protein [Acidimicrobiia bacterium]